MLEGLVTTLLNRFLGMYLKNLDTKQLQVGIWSGQVTLKDLELRREALDQLKLPVNVVEGHVGTLTLEIPLSNIRGKPVRINIEDVFLLAAPKIDAEYNEEEERQRAQALKMEKLDNAELLKERSASNLSQEDQQKNQSFMDSLVTAVVDNLQISVKNIHLRYEDSIATPGHPFTLGVTLQEFSAVSTDSDWKPTFIQSASTTTHKLATLGSLAVYWNTNAQLWGTGKGNEVGAEAQDVDHEDLKSKFMEAIHDTANHQYMLKPVSGRAGIEVDKTGQSDKPHIKARLLFKEFAFMLDDEQYRDALMVVDLFHYFARHQEYKKYQPKESPKENPRAWLRFAGQAVLQQIHERNRRWTWDYMRERRNDRIRYIELFKKQKRNETLTADEQKDLTALNEKLSYEDLRFWRSLARSQLRKEDVGVKHEQKQTWGQWFWGTNKPDQSHDEDGEAEMSEDERQQLYKAIDWDEKKAIAESIDVPRDSIKLQIESSLRSGSFTLRKDPRGKSEEILNLIFDDLQAKALTRPDSMLIDFSLGGLRAYDGTTPGTLFPQMIKAKDAQNVPKNNVSDEDKDEDISPPDSEKPAEVPFNPLFRLCFENHPLDESADTALDVKLRSIEFIYNPRFVLGIAKFFKPPERHMESIGVLLETAGATVEGLRQQTRAGLEFALQEHKTINAHLDIQAPLIIIPESITEESTICLILDAGHVALDSQLVDKATLAEIQSKQKTKYSEQDFKQLEGLMYDKFLLKLDSTQALIGPGIEATRQQLEEPESAQNYHIIDRINMDFTLETSIIPKAADLTKTRISGHLPVLHASISDRKYKDLMKIIDIAIPKFDTDDSLDGRTPAPTHRNSAPGSETSHTEVKSTRPRSKSFQLRQQQQSIDLDDDSDEDRDAPPKTPSSDKINLHQRNFEFKFIVDRLQGSLYKADPDGRRPDQLLVELVAQHFSLDFYLRPFDMVAEVLLRSVSIEDFIESDPSPEFKKIISSQDVDRKDAQDLLNVRFVRVSPNSPEFQSTYDGISMNLDVVVSTLNLVVTRKTLLTLLDFILVTFATPDDRGSTAQIETQQPKQTNAGNSDAKSSENAGSDKIRIKVDLSSVALILNNDGIRLATLRLSKADVGVFLADGCMRIDARLGDLSLLDDVNQGAPADSPLRQLVTIQGEELADFRYQTYNAKADRYPGYDSKVFLRSGSIKVNFVEEPFRKIIEFLVRFGKMQAIYNAARQAAANSANQMQESASKMQFDILIRTPIVVFPRPILDSDQQNLITAYLGELYLNNKFATVKASKSGVSANKISAGVRNIRLTSFFHYDDDVSEELELIDKVDIGFSIKYIEHEAGLQRPDTEVEGHLTPVNLRLAQSQLKLLLELSRSVPGAFATEPDNSEAEAVKALPKSTVEPARSVSKLAVREKQDDTPSSDQAPELTSSTEVWTRLDLSFKADSIGMELILGRENKPIGDVRAASFSKFAVNGTSVKLKMQSDGGLESELLVRSFEVTDTRNKESNRFRRIMSLVNDEVKQQFMANFSIAGGQDKHLIAMVSFDSPRVIFAVDYLAALSAFVGAAFKSDEPEVLEDDQSEEIDLDEDLSSPIRTPSIASTRGSSEEPSNSMSISFRVNIEDAQVILIANPAISNSEAIVLGTKQVLVAKQNASTLQISKVGMFLCRMDKFETSRLRILDDFSVLLSMDDRSQGPNTSVTTVSIDVEPLVLRLSLRDILLALQIINKVSEIGADDTEKLQDSEPQKIKQVRADAAASTRGPAPSVRPTSTLAKRTHRSGAKSREIPKPQPRSRSITRLKKEELTADVHGIRVIIIGDRHELPLLDWSVKKFGAEVRDWSGEMTGDSTFETYINVFNFSKSAWEPLIEPWQLGFHLARQQRPEHLDVDVFSHKNLELTVTSATIALASKSVAFLSTDEDVLSKPRGMDAPFRIRNYTGFSLNVWAASREEDSGSAAKMEDGDEIPWRFEDQTRMREDLSPDGKTGVVGIKLEGSGFDSVERIPVSREGATLYNLKPKQENVQHRLEVEVKLGDDSIKYITFRSPLVIENNTQIPVELGVFSPSEGHLLKIEKILPGDARPAPVGAAYKYPLVVRPDQGFGYAWSSDRLFWRDLLKRNVRTVTCKGDSGDDSPPFHFQVSANYDKNDPLVKDYPHMRIRLSAPIELQNLLPFDFQYRIYDKTTKKDWTNFLRKGGISPVHVVDLSHLLLLSIDLQDTVFKQSDFVVINSNTQEDYKRDSTLPVQDPQGNQLKLKLHYFNVPDSGGAFKVSVYSPYVVLNKTGLDLKIQSKTTFSSARSAAGQGLLTGSGEGSRKALPYMFSYPSEDRKNRALLQIGDSQWSKPQSFDAIGSSTEAGIPSSNGKTEMQIGIAVTEGEGKYNLSKVVTITPRYIIKNKVSESIQIREAGSSDFFTMKSGDLLPLKFLRQSSEKQICLCYPGVNNQWSSPFNISNVGTVHVKLAKQGKRQDLIRVEVIMEDATIFLHLSVESKHWPYSMRNESDTEFMFYQKNPNLGEDEEDRGSGWRPIRYRLPPRSIMPYAWDYPAARDKELILVANGKERRIKLAEIGNLIPMKIPAAQGASQSKIIDLNIAADGPTQTLVLSNYKPTKSLYKQKHAGPSSSTGFEVKDIHSDVTFRAQLRLAGIGISLVNVQMKELLYATFREMEFKYEDSKLYQTFNTTIKWIQIDNQLYGGIFPIILYPSVVPKTGKEMEAHPIFHAVITRVKDDSYGVLYIKYATLLLQQMTMEIDEDFIFALIDFSKVPGALWTTQVDGKLCDEQLDIPEPKQDQQNQDVYFELLHLQPMQLDISFVRTERVNAEDTLTSSNPLMFFVNIMTMSIGNVNDAPLRLNALILENARVSVPALINNVRSHYTQEVLRQIHIVLGSADFLGNPVGLFTNISSGVADIFYEPYQGLVMTDRPQELGIGIAKGASSFVKKSVFGFSDSMAKFTGSMSKGLAAATLDKEYQDQRRMSRSRNRPKHALYGVTAGGNAFASSMASGIGGLARHPIEGAEKEGLPGFVKGIGKGVLGLATKPAIGAFDLASNLAEGVRNTTTVFDSDGLDRVRLTRFIAIDGIVRPYSQREALGQFWLKTLDDGKYFNEDYIAHLELPGRDLMVMITYSHILLVKTKRLKSEWDIRLTQIMTIRKERTGLGITLKGGTNGPFIPVSDESARNWLYMQVAVAVNAFNDKYNARN